MTHRIVFDLQTGITTQVEYTPEEQAVHDAAVAAQAAAELAAQQAAELAAQQVTPAETPQV
jgi:hypothetical protein